MVFRNPAGSRQRGHVSTDDADFADGKRLVRRQRPGVSRSEDPHPASRRSGTDALGAECDSHRGLSQPKRQPRTQHIRYGSSSDLTARRNRGAGLSPSFSSSPSASMQAARVLGTSHSASAECARLDLTRPRTESLRLGMIRSSHSRDERVCPPSWSRTCP